MGRNKTITGRLTDRNVDAAAPRRVGLSVATEGRLRAKLLRKCPSAPWVDAQFKSFADRDERGKPIVYRRHDPSVFPPGGARTAMVRCPACGVYMPPNAFEGGLCLDHIRDEPGLDPSLGWGRSPSAVTIEKLQYRNGRILASALAPESPAALRKEIRHSGKKSGAKGSSAA